MLDIPDVTLDDATTTTGVDRADDATMTELDPAGADTYKYWETHLLSESLDPSLDWPWVIPSELTVSELLELLREALNRELAGNPWWDSQFWTMQTLSFNCTVAVSQDIITAYGVDISEGELTEIMIREGWLSEAGGSLGTVGATLAHVGISSHTCYDATFDDLFAELVAGHKVVIPVDSSELWDQSAFGELWDWMTDLGGGTADHVVWVTGIDMTDPDNPTVTINDTGHPDGQGAVYPLNEVREAWEDSRFSYVATDFPPSEYVQPEVFS